MSSPEALSTRKGCDTDLYILGGGGGGVHPVGFSKEKCWVSTSPLGCYLSPNSNDMSVCSVSVQ